MRAGQRVLIAAHGNSLRALVKYLDDVSDEEIVELNIPTGRAAGLRARRRPEADPPLLPRRSRPGRGRRAAVAGQAREAPGPATGPARRATIPRLRIHQ